MTRPSVLSKPRLRLLRRALVVLGTVLTVALLWKPLAAWFTGKPLLSQSPKEGASPHGHEHPGARPSDAQQGFTPEAAQHLRAALSQYDAARSLLVQDRLEGLPGAAERIAQSLTAARAASAAPPPQVTLLGRGVEEARALGAATTLENARARFAELSRTLLEAAASTSALQAEVHAFQCPMAEGFDKWLQLSPKLENPYMGQRMVACGTKAELASASPKVTSPTDTSEGGVAYYTCPMHPSVKRDAPGACPICGMDLTPVTKEEVSSGVIRVDETRSPRIGITTAEVVEAPMDLSFAALGRVTVDETAIEEVTLKLDGYIAKLRVAATGQPVKKGEVLFTLYSPELYAAQTEYLLARNSQSAANASLVRAARKRLELWGLTAARIEHIAQKGEAQEDVPFLSPASGFVLEKNVTAGAAVKAGDRLFRIAPLDKVWVEASVFERDLARVKVGQPVVVTLRHLPGRTFSGSVGYIYPTLEEKTRTGKIRIELPNVGLELKPEMYADVRFEQKGAPRLQVPEEAVLYTGPRRLVFVDLGDGRMRPQEVKLGVASDGAYEVLEGLKPGDRVVTSGNFLVAAESRLRSAGDATGGGGEIHDAH